MATYRSLVAAAVLAALFMSTAIGQEPRDEGTVTAESVPETEKTAAFTLGITVTDSPGDGVRVDGVLWGGPADRAGIRTGDFLMFVEGESIQTPGDLRNAVQRIGLNGNLDIGIWRNGESLSKKVAREPKFAEPGRDKAWLGVMLESTAGGKVLVADVVPASPASNGGIQVGDKILRIDAEEIDSAKELLDLMKRIKSGDNIDITVLRNGQERTFTVRVGSAIQTTMRWFQDRLPSGFDRGWSDVIPSGADLDEYRGSLEEMMQRMRKELKALRDEVNHLRDKSDAGDGDSDAEEREESEADSASKEEAF